MMLISSFVCWGFSLLMFFILKLMSLVNPVTILKLNSETNLNYFDIRLTIFPIILGVAGFVLLIFHIYLAVNAKRK